MSTRRELLVLVLLAITVRGGFMAAMYRGLENDPDLYRDIAVQIRTTGQFARTVYNEGPQRTAFRPPLYPLLLRPLVWNNEFPKLSVAVLHVMLGVATVVGTFLLARRLGLTWPAWAAAVLVLLDPILLNQASLVMTETLAALLTVLALTTLVRWSEQPNWKRALLAGAAIGLCVLCRPTYLIWLPLVLGEVLIRGLSAHRSSRRLRELFALIAGAAIVLAPWTIRNALVFGKPIVATTHGGYTLQLGNNPNFYMFLREGRWNDAWEPKSLSVDEYIRQKFRRFNLSQSATPQQIELLDDQQEYDNAIKAIRAEPNMFALACVYRLWQFWSPLPNRVSANQLPPDDRRTSPNGVSSADYQYSIGRGVQPLVPSESRFKMLARYAVALWYVLVYILAICGLSWWRQGQARQGAMWAATLVAAFMLVHTFYWTNLRMRAPIMPVVAITAAAGLAKVWQKQSNSTKSSEVRDRRSDNQH